MRVETPEAWARRGWISAALAPLALLFGAAAAVRRTAYRRGWIAALGAGAPVVVIGNITVGGTGKTPITGWLAERLAKAGRCPAVVSRGYAGRRQTAPVRVTPDSDPFEVGDEPVMLALQTGCPVWVCVNRALAARRAVEEGADIVLSDDGLQHYRMARDLEFCVIDGARRLGNGRLLPAGPLREPANRLNEVDAVLVQGRTSDFQGLEFGPRIDRALPPDPSASLRLEFELRIDRALQLNGSRERPLKEFAGRKILALAGTGAPARFYAALESAGLAVEPIPVPDHGAVPVDSLLACRRPVLMTAKDAVKYRGVAAEHIWWAPANVVMAERSAGQIVSRVLDLLD